MWKEKSSIHTCVCECLYILKPRANKNALASYSDSLTPFLFKWVFQHIQILFIVCVILILYLKWLEIISNFFLNSSGCSFSFSLSLAISLSPSLYPGVVLTYRSRRITTLNAFLTSPIHMHTSVLFRCVLNSLTVQHMSYVFMINNLRASAKHSSSYILKNLLHLS